MLLPWWTRYEGQGTCLAAENATLLDFTFTLRWLP